MAEKRRGLGRGLGALIPDVVSEDRPVDVFFPSQSTSEDTASGSGRETAASRLARDPAANMRRAHTQKKNGGKKQEGPGSRDHIAQGATEQTAETAEAGSSGSGDVSRETDLKSVPGTAFGLIEVESIRANPKQPRSIFDEDALEELVHSIKEVGVLQPIVVRVVDSSAPTYELIMGERRLRASKEAGMEAIPAIIREVPETDLLRDALLENLHRVDLNPLEEAAAYRQLLDDFQCTQEELSERIGRSRPQITNTLRLLKLPPLVQRRVAAGVISQGHARAILGLIDGAQMEVLAQRVVAEGLSVRATEEAVVLMNNGEKQRGSREVRPYNPEFASIARTIGDRLDTRVNITMGKNKGKISVEFANEDDLKRILDTLGLVAGTS
ncbi:hypothetical protein GCM10022261_00850 [Brevibacterium daeguense]|uniref:ParB-like N-terminal domain-containing protein n=1 Tax=Brevibacterium daeguense TaxID=909936 RepID=A0ABP8EF05_9MICO|nr:ParB/RepB/Spo0J family partition protein [Brevibacterium daeguense]